MLSLATKHTRQAACTDYSKKIKNRKGIHFQIYIIFFLFYITWNKIETGNEFLKRKYYFSKTSTLHKYFVRWSKCLILIKVKAMRLKNMSMSRDHNGRSAQQLLWAFSCGVTSAITSFKFKCDFPKRPDLSYTFYVS